MPPGFYQLSAEIPCDPPIQSDLLTITVVGEPVKACTVSIGTEQTVSRRSLFSTAVNIEDADDLAGFQLDIVFNPDILQAFGVEEGTFLSRSGGTYCLEPDMDNSIGVITAITCARTGQGGVSGSGILAAITFKAIGAGESYIRLQNIRLSDPNGTSIPAKAIDGSVTVIEFPPWDVNKDGRVDIFDLVLVGQRFGEIITIPPDLNPDVNGDGEVDIFDLVLVGQHFGEVYSPAAPPGDICSVDPQYLPVLVKMFNIMVDKPNCDPDFLATKRLLHRLIFNARITETEVLQNYPNPFNPETWIPYKLAKGADVLISIYDSAGRLIRILDFGYKPAGSYLGKERAAYWDGKNDWGEKAASGVYFCRFEAGGLIAASKLVIGR